MPLLLGYTGERRPLEQGSHLPFGLFRPAHIFLCHPAKRSLRKELHLRHPPYECGVLLLNYGALKLPIVVLPHA